MVRILALHFFPSSRIFDRQEGAQANISNKGDLAMNNMQSQISDYLTYCSFQKRLDEKTVKAYRIDLRQFSEQMHAAELTEITSAMLEAYIGRLHRQYRPRSVRRKIASVKSFFHYLEYREIIERNPFGKIQIRFREPVILPKTIPLTTVEAFLSAIYRQREHGKTEYQKKNALRDAAVAELLFATGMRISELCALKESDVDLDDGTILIYGKGDKERRIQIGTKSVLRVLKEYKSAFQKEIKAGRRFFASQSGRALSDQAARRMIRKYASLASIDLRITPHMFRHTFATSLLEAGVDIRFIQEMLGHSSIHITEVYTHVTVKKQRDILAAKHPRNDFKI